MHDSIRQRCYSSITHNYTDISAHAILQSTGSLAISTWCRSDASEKGVACIPPLATQPNGYPSHAASIENHITSLLSVRGALLSIARRGRDTREQERAASPHDASITASRLTWTPPRAGEALQFGACSVKFCRGSTEIWASSCETTGGCTRQAIYNEWGVGGHKF